MTDRVRKPEWLKINIAAVGVALIWGNVGEKEQPPS